MKKKLLSITICILIVLCTAVPCFGADFDEKVYTDRYVIMDLKTGTILASKNTDLKSYPASITKLVTAMVVYDYYKDTALGLKTLVYADQEAADTEPTRYGLAVGERMTVDEALNIMLVRSANDIAVMFAKEIGGSTDYFGRIMTEKAEELGCTNTNFVTPNGLHDDEHYTTVEDLTKIVCAFMSNEYLAAIVAQDHYDYAATNKQGAGTVYSTNKLFTDETRIYVGNEIRTCKYDGATILGIKTGTTEEAGGCLAAAAQKGDTTIMIIILNSRADEYSYTYERYADAHKMFDWAFENYKTFNTFNYGDDFGIVQVKRGEFNKVSAVLSQDVYLTLPSDALADDITTEVALAEKVKAPIEEGAILGNVKVKYKGEILGTYQLIASKSVAKGGILSIFGIEDAQAKVIFGVALKVLIGIAVLFVILVAIRLYNKAQAKKRKAERARQRAEQELKKREEWGREYDKTHYGKK